MSVLELEQAFEKLSPKEQEQFAQWYEGKLAQSGFDPAIEAAWAAEVDRRIAEIESGQVQGIPAEQVFAEARKRLGRAS
jgi:putative addiction module component (TIGR02574 family)